MGLLHFNTDALFTDMATQLGAFLRDHFPAGFGVCVANLSIFLHIYINTSQTSPINK